VSAATDPAQLKASERLMHSCIRTILAAAAASTSMAGAVMAATAPLNVRGTIEDVSRNSLSVKEHNGSSVIVHLTNDARIASVAPARLSDVKPGSFIGTAAVPQADGTLKAIEIHIFPASMRGTGEGFHAWDLAPRSSMTNGTVAREVKKIAGDRLTVDFRGGEKLVTVTPATKVVALEVADHGALEPNEKIFIPAASRNPDGSLEASRVTVGKNGVTPPM
jgi:hypothetical protein